ncbi:hypothetical protein V8D89_002081 [Ganoderma adspersum]
MFVKSFPSFVLLTGLCVPHVSAAIVSLYLPPDLAGNIPYTADPIGVDKSGHTTWCYSISAASGTFTATSPGLPETSGMHVLIQSLLVADATDFQVIAVDGLTSVNVNCALATSTASGGVLIAACSEQVAAATTAKFAQPLVTLTPFPVQVPDNYNLTSSGGSVVAAVTTSSGSTQPSVTSSPVPAQVPADNSKSSSTWSSRMSLGGVVVSVLVVLSTVGLKLAQV